MRTQIITPRIITLGKSFWLIYLAGYVTLISVAVAYVWVTPATEWPLTLSLLFIFGLLFGASIFLFDAKPIHTHLYLFAQTIIILGLITLNPNYTNAIGILFLPITSQAPLFLSMGAGFLWVLIYYAIAVASFVIAAGGNVSAIMIDSVLSSGGYLAFGAFGATLRQAEERREESQTLLSELQEVYAQLQQYTQQAEALAVSQERDRIAREMHDALGHRLTVAVVQLEGARRLIPKEPERAAVIIDLMREQLKKALAELRQTVSSLRLATNENKPIGDLKTAVTNLVHTFQNATNLIVHLSLDNELPPLPPAQTHALYRAVQESLTNIQRHANATTAWVGIHMTAQDIQLKTQDDGVGFSSPIEDGRFGIKGLEERAAEFGGTLTVKARPTGGTELCFSLPLPSLVHE